VIVELVLNSSCCEWIDRWLGIALLPGVWVAIAVGGGAHVAGPLRLAIGLALGDC
jgi:hypothetical protein